MFILIKIQLPLRFCRREIPVTPRAMWPVCSLPTLYKKLSMEIITNVTRLSKIEEWWAPLAKALKKGFQFHYLFVTHKMAFPALSVQYTRARDLKLTASANQVSLFDIRVDCAILRWLIDSHHSCHQLINMLCTGKGYLFSRGGRLPYLNLKDFVRCKYPPCTLWGLWCL